jgi:hypothetical protein
LVARRLNPVTFFEMVASQDGLQLPSHERQRERRVLRVEDAMRPVAANYTAGRGDMPLLHPDQSLDTALHLFGDRAVLAVVSREEVTRVLGELALDDVLRAYGVRRSDEVRTIDPDDVRERRGEPAPGTMP